MDDQTDLRWRRARLHRLALCVSTTSPGHSFIARSILIARVLTSSLPLRIYEVQAFLTELVSNFQFDLTEEVDRICKTTAIVMVPTLKDELSKGVQMPLRVSLAPRDE